MTCELRPHENMTLFLRFSALLDGAPLKASQKTGIHLLNTFPLALEMQQIETGMVFLNDSDRCIMGFGYPGNMKATRSPYLRDRPLECWPTVDLHLDLTDELLGRAKTVVDFLLLRSPDQELN